MTASIAALVIGLPERVKLLHEALDSVAAQTRKPDDVLIGLDPRRYGEAGNFNRLLDATTCDWVAFLHDDDLWHPGHLAAAQEHIDRDDCDVIVADFRSVGRPQDTFEPYHDDPADYLYTNWHPPAVVVARKETFGHWIEGRAPLDDPWAASTYDAQGRVIRNRRNYGQRLHSNAPWIDWANWRRLYHEGARFARTRRRTVDYRFGDWDNGSWTPAQAAAAARPAAPAPDLDGARALFESMRTRGR